MKIGFSLRRFPPGFPSQPISCLLLTFCILLLIRRIHDSALCSSSRPPAASNLCILPLTHPLQPSQPVCSPLNSPLQHSTRSDCSSDVLRLNPALPGPFCIEARRFHCSCGRNCSSSASYQNALTETHINMLRMCLRHQTAPRTPPLVRLPKINAVFAPVLLEPHQGNARIHLLQNNRELSSLSGRGVSIVLLYTGE